MKTVKLSQPTTVNGELRNPIEGPIICSDEEAERLFENGLSEGEPEDFHPAGSGEDEDESLEERALPDLGIPVEKEGVPLNGTTKKPAIQKHREEKAAG